MEFSKLVVGGRKVRWSELVLALKVTIPSYSDYPRFLKDNQSRIAEPEQREPLERGDRGGTEDIPDCNVVLTLFNPPGQSRSHFTIGRDPRCCDIVCANRTVSNQHVKFVFESDHLVLYDVSRLGSMLAVQGCQRQQTTPKEGVPYKCFLPPGSEVNLEIPGYSFKIDVVLRLGLRLDEFRRKRDAFLATCCDLGALSLASQIPTQLPSASLRAPQNEGQNHLYWFESQLGQGGFGTVRKVRRLQDWAVFAAKHVLERGESGTEFDFKCRSLKQEMATLQSLKHERIVEYVDWFEDANGRWNLVMECCHHGNLYDMIQAAATPFPPHQAAQILKQAAQGLRYLHDQGVTHRDLKPSNILVRSRAPLSLALCDFGIAKRGLNDGEMMKTMIGTASYMAPEMWRSGGGYTKEVDIWSLGVVGLELVLRKLPIFDEKAPPARYPRLLAKTAQDAGRNAPNNEFVALVTRLLVLDPRKRPNAAECIKHADSVPGPSHSTQPTASGSESGIKTPSGSTWMPQSAEIRAMEKYLETSGSGPFQGRSAATVVPRKQPGPPQSHIGTQRGVFTQSSVGAQPRSNSPATERPPPPHKQKRGTDALPRSNSMEAPASKLPRTEEQRLRPRKTVGAGHPSQTASRPATQKRDTGSLPRAIPPAMNPSRQQNSTPSKVGASPPRANSPATDVPRQIKPTQREAATDGPLPRPNSAASSTQHPTPKSGASVPPLQPRSKGPVSRETSQPAKAVEKT